MAQGARQNTGQEAIVNLSKKLDEMLTVVADQYELQTQYLSSIDTIGREGALPELKAQTQILASIEAKLSAASSKGPAVDESGMKEYAKAFGSMAGAILDLIEKADDKAADKLSNFFTKLSTSINDLTKNVDEEKATALATVIETIAKGVISFGFWLTLATPLLATSLLGATLLGLNLKILLGIIGDVNPNSIEALSVVVAIGWEVLRFGLIMSLYTILAPTALIGSMLFGLTVRLLFKIVGSPEVENSIAAMNAVIGLGWGVLAFGLIMSLYVILAPTALIGSVLFGLTVRLLMKITDIDSEKSIAAMNSVMGLGWGVLAFGLIMSLYVILAPTALIGAVLFGLTVRLLMKITDIDSDKSIAAMNAVMGLGWGVLAFGLIMTFYVILAPTAMIGAVLFGLTVRLLMKITNVDSEKSIAAINAITGLGWGVLAFGLIMTFYTILAPTALIGAVLFGLTVRLLLKITNMDDKDSIRGIEGINKLGLGVIMFGIAMSLYLILGIPALLGTVLFAVTIYLLMIVMKELGDRKVKKGIKGLMMLVLGIALFGIAVVLFSKFVPAKDAMYVIGITALFALTFILIGKFSRDIKKGGKAILYAVVAVAALGIAMMIWKKAEVTLKDGITLAATITGLGVIAFVAGKFATDIEKGAIALGFAGLAIIAIAGGMYIWHKAEVKGQDIINLGLLILTIGLEMAAAGFGAILIIAGAAAMTIAAIPILALAGVMALWTAAGVKDKDVSTLGHAIYTVGETLAGVGFMSPLVLLGAAAMTVAAIPILAITGSLAVFRSAGINNETSDNLSYALEAVVSGFLGGKMPGGILDGIKFAAGAAARAALLAVASVGFLAAGVALIPITASLVTFKKADFTTTDADNLEYMLSSVVKAFGIVTDYKRQKELGFYVNPFDLFLGIQSLSGAGRVLAGLAGGVQAWANLEVNEWEVVGGGTKDAKLVIKGRRKLTQTDFADAAFGMGQVISAIAKPFAEVGRLEKGGLSGNPLIDAIFGGGFVSTGINALKRSGDTLVSLAQGVQAFANLEITEYEVVAAGTKDAKLVPKSKRKLSPMEIAMAGINIGTIISVVAGAFAEIGKAEKNSSGIFSGGFVSKGVSSLAGVGDILKSVTEGVIAMAHNEIPQFDLINAGTKDAKLVPGKPLILRDSDLKAAAYNIGEILGVIASAVANIGKMEADTKGWFSGGYVSKGVASLGNIGDTIGAISKAVLDFATGSVTTFDLIGGGTKDAKLVPGKTIRLTSADMQKAGDTIGNILSTIGYKVGWFGSWAADNEDALSAGIDASKDISEILTKSAEGIAEWAKVQKTDEVVKNISLYFSTIKSIFDPAKNKDLDKSTWHFTKFAENMKLVSEAEDPLAKTAKSMDSIQKSMKLMKDSINGMDLKKLTLTDSMMKSIAALSKNPEAMAKVIAQSINKSYEELIKALKELSGSSGGGGTAKPAATTTATTTTTNKTETKAKTENKPAAKDAKNFENTNVKGAQKVYIVNAPKGWN